VPVVTGDSLYANEKSRAEVQLGEGSFLRMGNGALAGFLQNSKDAMQLKLTSGTTTLRLQQMDRAYEIDTPSMAFIPRQAGEYRIDVNDSGDSEVTVHEGAGTISMPEGREESLIAPARLKIFKEQSQTQNGPKPERDGWDQWNTDRDNLVLHSASREFVPPGVAGYDLLDSYGSWVDHPSYGHVWRPNVAPDWQPYRAGRWIWVDPYGWTWTSYEPWGFAPYHYGRWAYSGDTGWIWVPGPPTIRQQYAPALVAFVNGDDWMGWMPLGPGEAYEPVYVREVYVGQPAIRYVNYQYVTVVNRTEIYSSTKIYNYRVIDRRIIERTRVGMASNLAPAKENLYVAPATSRSTQARWAPSRQSGNTPVYAKNTNVPVVRSFDEKLTEIHKQGTVRPVRTVASFTNGSSRTTKQPNSQLLPVASSKGSNVDAGPVRTLEPKHFAVRESCSRRSGANP
jgi:hypothetical protein